MQIEEAVYHLFGWNQGSFHFDPDQRPDEDGLFLVDINIESLLMEGARRTDEWSLVEKKIPSFDIVLQLDKNPDESDEEVELSREQRKVLPFIDGVRTVTEIMNEAGLVEFDTGKALYGLIQGGFVSRSGEKSTAAETGGDQKLQEHLNLGVAFYRSGHDGGRGAGVRGCPGGGPPPGPRELHAGPDGVPEGAARRGAGALRRDAGRRAPRRTRSSATGPSPSSSSAATTRPWRRWTVRTRPVPRITRSTC